MAMADQQPSQADIFAALSSQSAFRKQQPPKTLTYTDFTEPFTDLLVLDMNEKGEAEAGPSRRNKTRLHCFREGCGSLILLEKAGLVVETHEAVLPEETSSPFPSSSPSPAQSSLTTDNAEKSIGAQYLYLRIPSPFDFENIGYSRPDTSTTLPPGAPGLSEAKGKVKWLICAECDLGPVGWGFEGGKEAWVDMQRVRYAAPPSGAIKS